MRVLLDTHAFLWWVGDDTRLSERARTAIADAGECFLSVVSCWEMAIKVGQGKLTLPVPVETFVSEHIAANGFTMLPLELEHVARVARLAFHHRDPFDRALAVQALAERLTMVSVDPIFRKYGVKRVW